MKGVLGPFPVVFPVTKPFDIRTLLESGGQKFPK